jgi:O-antigen ligase
MDLLLPMAVSFSLSSRRFGMPKILCGSVVAVDLAAVVLSQSRGGVLALSFEAAVALLLFWRPRGHRRRDWTVVLFALAALGAVLAVGWRPLAARFGDFNQRDPSVAGRLAVDRAAVRMWRDYPIVGTGLGTFATVYPGYAQFHSGKRFDHAHNDYAETLVETGLLGAACALFFLLAYVGGFWRRLRSEPPPVRVQKAAFVATLGLLFHAGYDFQFHCPANALLFFFLVAAASARLQSGASRHRQREGLVLATGSPGLGASL